MMIAFSLLCWIRHIIHESLSLCRKGRIEGTDEPHFAYEYDNWILHTISSTDTLTERQTGVQT